MVEEQIVIDKKIMKELIEFIEEAVKERLSKKEIMSQIELMLDKDLQKQLEEGIKDVKEDKVKKFKNVDEAIAWLK